MLDCYNLVLNNELFNKELEPLFRDKSQMMLSWINMITFKNGNIPLMNDAAFNIAPIPKSLNEYALRLGLDINIPIKLNESGYRKLESSKFELIADVGNIGPDYQPGHAHADTFNFELYVNGRPVIIDTGTSTYEVNNIRFYERGTSAHNTVVVNDTNSSQVWSGHRVAKRAKVKIINDLPDLIVATHNGYQSFGQTPKRTFQKLNSCIRIIDELENKGDFYLHFSPNEEIEIVDKIIIGKDFQIEFIGGGNIECFLSEFSPEFNKKIFRKSIRIEFSNKLETLFK